MATLSKPDALRLLSTLEEVDGDKIDGIDSVGKDANGDVVGVYFKRHENKKYRFAYKLRDTQAATTPLGAEVTFSEVEPLLDEALLLIFTEPEPTPEPVKFAAPAPDATKVKVCFDTEFNEDGRTIDLISIGMTTEDGRKYYAISSEFDENAVNDWVRENVLTKLEPPDVVPRKPRAQIRDEIVAFMGGQIPEFWAFYATSDWVCLYQLFGRLVDLPPGWPHICYDLKQLQKHLGVENKEFPNKPKNQHNALADAEWNLAALKVLQERAELGRTIQLQEPQAEHPNPELEGTASTGFSNIQEAITQLTRQVAELTQAQQAALKPKRPVRPVNATNFRDWDKAKRDKLAAGKSKGGFAGPNQTYPVSNAEDAKNAWNLAGRAADPDQVRRNVIRIAKKLRLVNALPATAKAWAAERGIELAESIFETDFETVLEATPNELEQVQQLYAKLQSSDFSELEIGIPQQCFLAATTATARHRDRLYTAKADQVSAVRSAIGRLEVEGLSFFENLWLQQVIQAGVSND